MAFHQPAAVIHKAQYNEYLRRAIDTEEYRGAMALREQAMERRANLPAVNPPPEPSTPGEVGDWEDAVSQTHAAEADRKIRFNALTT